MCLLVLYLTVPPVEADVINMGVDAFGPGSTLTTFTGLPLGTEVNGLTVDGILYTHSLGNGHMQISRGPNSNNIQGELITEGRFSREGGSLTLTFPSFMSAFGYGFAIDASPFPEASVTGVQLFSGATNVGSTSRGARPDPINLGGFLGIQSTIPFNSATVTFFNDRSLGLYMDNVRTVGVPEPSTFVLLGAGIGLLLSWRRIRHAGGFDFTSLVSSRRPR